MHQVCRIFILLISNIKGISWYLSFESDSYEAANQVCPRIPRIYPVYSAVSTTKQDHQRGDHIVDER